MKKVLTILGIFFAITCQAQLIRPTEYKGMPAYYWKIKKTIINDQNNTTTFELWLYFNTSTYFNDSALNQLDRYEQVTVDSVVLNRSSESTYQLIKDNSDFFNNAILANTLEYSAMDIDQEISDTILNNDTIKRKVRVKLPIHDIKGKTIVTSLFVDYYKNNVKVDTHTIFLVVDNMFKFDGTQISEYDYFVQNMFDNNLTFRQALINGILYADAYGIINAKLKGLR